MASYAIRVIALAFFATIGVMCVILACALPAYKEDKWLPMIVIVSYVLAPIPLWLAKKCGGGDDLLGSSGGSVDFGYFATAFFVISGFGIPLVMAHANAIKMGALILTLVGNVFVFITIWVYHYAFDRDDDW